jgi:CRISPR/Cas system-associated exonuclease Cas4 (RecB family)
MTDTEFRTISNSEATDFDTCKRLYLNAYVKQLAPKTRKGPLAIGTVGHLGFERYYKGRIAGESHEVAYEEALRVLTKELTKEDFDMEDILKAREGLERYFKHYGDEADRYEFLEVEEEYKMPMPHRNNYDYGFKIDLLLRDKRTGHLILRDWKFTYDFWRPRKFILRGQFPKYVLGLRYNGKSVDFVEIDQIRYREMKDKEDLTKYLRRDPQKVSNTKIRHVLKDHIVLSDEIMLFRSLTPEKQEHLATRLMVDPICKGCGFAELCELELEDGHTQEFIKENYVTNTYGYNEKTDETLAGIV